VNECFIKEALTYKCEDRDFPEWHRGRQRYAVWALEINNDAWQTELVNARKMLAKYLLAGEQRQAHVTLFAYGFYDESGNDGVSPEVINTQAEALKKRCFSPFKIHLSELRSFLSAPYFAIEDKTGTLGEIRSILSTYLNEDGISEGSINENCINENSINGKMSSEYQPHLTVGLYNDQYSSALLSEKLNEYKPERTPAVLINKISLMSFATHSVFSPLKTELQLELNN